MLALYPEYRAINNHTIKQYLKFLAQGSTCSSLTMHISLIFILYKGIATWFASIVVSDKRNLKQMVINYTKYDRKTNSFDWSK